MAEADDLTPEEWVTRLGRKINQRRPKIDLWQRYYKGSHDLPAGPQQHKDAFRRFQRLSRTNLCGLCVDSRVHRMKVSGYRDGTARGGNDAAVWRMWQEARLDSRQFTVYRKAWALSAAYCIVAPDPRDPSGTKPRVSIEGPGNVYVELDPADSSVRLAALRMWHDALAKRWYATLWLPGWRYPYQSRNEHKEGYVPTTDFTESFWEPRGEPERSAPEVPVIPFWNGDEGDDPVAAFDPGLDVQNRLNLTMLNRLTAERYAAFRQRYLLNYEPEEDPATGLPIPPFNPGADQTLTIPPPEPGMPEPKIGDLAQTDTSGMLRGTEMDIRSFAAVTITPVYYLPGGDLTNIGEGTIVALDAGHMQSIKERMAAWSECWEEVLQLCADIAHVEKDLSSSEIVWDQPESFNQAATADYLTKLTGSGVPLPMAVEQIGWTPQQIDRLRTEMTQEALRQQLMQPPAAGAGGATPTRTAAPGGRPAPARTGAQAGTQAGARPPAGPAGAGTPGTSSG